MASFALCCCCKGKEEDAQDAIQLVDVHGAADEGSALQEQIDVEEERQMDYEIDHQSTDRTEPVFTALFERKADQAQEPLGVIVDHTVDEKMLHVCEVDAAGDNPISRYNREHPDKQIRPGDYFLSLNPVQHNATVLASVSRPILFDVLVDTRGQDLGLYLTYSNTGRSLRITNVSHGAALHVRPKLKSGDRIVGVGSVEGRPAALMDAIKEAKGTEVLLRMSRPRTFDREGYPSEPISA